MRVFVLLLAMVSDVLAAEWVEVRGFSAAGITVYADTATIRRSGDMAKMQDVYNYKTMQVSGTGKRYLSSKGQGEYDCKNTRARHRFFTRYSGNMARGNVVTSNYHSDIKEIDRWGLVAPATVEENLWKIACKKK